jgi:hypothetical protein
VTTQDVLQGEFGELLERLTAQSVRWNVLSHGGSFRVVDSIPIKAIVSQIVKSAVRIRRATMKSRYLLSDRKGDLWACRQLTSNS